MQQWLIKYGPVIAFYLVVALLIYFNRKKFHFEGKIIAMYKTKIGLKLMDKIGKQHPKTIKALGVLGVFVGFTGMLFMLYFVGIGLYQLIFQPDAAPLFSPVIPGVSIPGSPVTVPLFEGIIALFLVVVIHEFSHGVMSRAYGIPIKSSGFVMFGPLPGAFVEPDEKKLLKASKKAQISIFAAGPFSNVLLTILIFLVLVVFGYATDLMYASNGVIITGFVNPQEGEDGGRLSTLSVGEIIYQVNKRKVLTLFNLSEALINVTPGQTVMLETNKGVKEVVLAKNPNNESQAYIGIYFNNHVVSKNEFAAIIKEPYFWFFGNPYDVDFNVRTGLLGWIFILSFGIGLVNLLPIGPVDGGRMYLLVLQKYLKDKTAKKVWENTAKAMLMLIIILIFVPIIRAIIP